MSRNWMLVCLTAGLALGIGCGDDDGDDSDPDMGNMDGGTDPDGGADPDGGTMGPLTVDFTGDDFDNDEATAMLLAAPGNLTDPDFNPTGDEDLSGGGTPAGDVIDTGATYIGAIEAGGADWTANWTAFPTTAGAPGLDLAGAIAVDGDITEDTTWTTGNVYQLNTNIFVQNATLTIEEGVTVVGAAADQSALIITSTASIEAEGTAAAPIVFTSGAGTRESGDWGGLVLLGLAPINAGGGQAAIEGLAPGEDRGLYGGTDPAHDCGTLRYVRIEFAGFVFGDDNELNGLTLGGCGTDTTVDFVQSHAGLDDAIEFFGGTVNASHLVASQFGDDGIDTDQGFVGTIQFAIVQHGSQSNHGFEMDNDEDDNDNEMPRSSPTIWNATIVGQGQDGQQGLEFAEGTSGGLFNSIVAGFGGDANNGPCIDITQDATIAQANEGNLAIDNVVYANCGSNGFVRAVPSE